MHNQVMDLLARMRESHGRAFAGHAILEVGARDINGNPRGLFNAGVYVGLDAIPGAKVDAVAIFHQWNAAPEFPDKYNTIVSTSTLEHDPYWKLTLEAMCARLEENGSLILAWAAPEFQIHNVNDSPEPGYYCGLTLEDVRCVVEKNASFSSTISHHDPIAGDASLFCFNKLKQEEKR